MLDEHETPAAAVEEEPPAPPPRAWQLDGDDLERSRKRISPSPALRLLQLDDTSDSTPLDDSVLEPASEDGSGDGGDIFDRFGGGGATISPVAKVKSTLLEPTPTPLERRQRFGSLFSTPRQPDDDDGDDDGDDGDAASLGVVQLEASVSEGFAGSELLSAGSAAGGVGLGASLAAPIAAAAASAASVGVRRRVSLAPSLKSLALDDSAGTNESTNDSDLDSPETSGTQKKNPKKKQKNKTRSTNRPLESVEPPTRETTHTPKKNHEIPSSLSFIRFFYGTNKFHRTHKPNPTYPHPFLFLK